MSSSLPVGGGFGSAGAPPPAASAEDNDATVSASIAGGEFDDLPQHRFSPSSPNPWDSVHVFSPTSIHSGGAPSSRPWTQHDARRAPVDLEAGEEHDESGAAPLLGRHRAGTRTSGASQGFSFGARSSSSSSSSSTSARRSHRHRRRRSSEGHRSEGESNTGFRARWASVRRTGKLMQHRSPYYIPILQWGPTYTLRTLGQDALAALTVAFVLIPQSLSYASQLILLEPIVGLYAAFSPLLVYALFGTSKHFAAGPEALTAILTGVSVNMGETFEERMADTILLTLLVGIFTLLMGIFRLGFLDSVLSRSLLRGFISAVAVAVSIEQLPALLGLAYHPAHAALSPAQNFVAIVHKINESNLATALTSLVAIFILWGIKWAKTTALARRQGKLAFLQHVPEILVVVTIGIILSASIGFHEKWQVAILGPSALKTAWPQWHLPVVNIQRIEKFASPAALIAIIGFFEATITVKHLASRHAYSISVNRELVALGLMNCVGSFLGAFPTFGSLARSLVMVRSGGQTQASGLLTGCMMLLTMVVVLPIFYYLPRCVMAAVIFTAVLSLLEFDDISFMIRIHAWRDLCLCLLTFCMTLFFSITFGVLISIVLSLLITIRQTSQPKLVTLGEYQRSDGTAQYVDVTEQPKAKQLPGTMIIKVDASLYFSNTAQMADRLRRLETFEDPRTHPSETGKSRIEPVTSIIFEMSGVHYIDASAMQVLCEVVEEHVSHRVQVKFVQLKRNNHKIFLRSGLVDALGEEHFHRTIPEALEAIKRTEEDESIPHSILTQ